MDIGSWLLPGASRTPASTVAPRSLRLSSKTWHDARLYQLFQTGGNRRGHACTVPAKYDLMRNMGARSSRVEVAPGEQVVHHLVVKLV